MEGLEMKELFGDSGLVEWKEKRLWIGISFCFRTGSSSTKTAAEAAAECSEYCLDIKRTLISSLCPNTVLLTTGIKASSKRPNKVFLLSLYIDIYKYILPPLPSHPLSHSLYTKIWKNCSTSSETPLELLVCSPFHFIRVIPSPLSSPAVCLLHSLVST